jgi:HlyD family type I secretion membrane fusion protein
MIRILIVDDQKTIRESVKLLLTEAKELQVVGTAVNGHDAIAQVNELQPDVVLMDIEMPELDGLSATKIISVQHPRVKILIFTIHDRDDLIAESLQVGARGYLLKNMSSQEIIRAIHFVWQGYTEIRPSIGIKANATNLTNSTLPVNSLSNTDSSQLASTRENKILSNLRVASPDEFLPPIKKGIVISGLACLSIFIGAIALSSQLKFKTSVKVHGKIRPMGELRIVQATAEGKIAQIAATENQYIKSGDSIARIDDRRLQSQKQQLLANIQRSKQQLSQLNAQNTSIQTQIAAQTNLQQRNLASAQTQLKHQQRLYQEQLITTQARVNQAQAAVELARDEFNRYQGLVRDKVVSQLQVKEKEAALKNSLAKLEEEKASLNPSSAEVEIAREQIAQETARGRSTLASLDLEQQRLNERKIEIQERLNNYQEQLNQITTDLKNTLIRAPISGRIQTINLRNQGQIVKSGDKIAEIIPTDAELIITNSRLQIQTTIDPQYIGMVEIGQTAKMQVSACFYPDFGTLDGKVVAISTDTKTFSHSENTSSIISSYEVFIKPEAWALEYDDALCVIKPGMEGQVEIIASEETVLQFMLSTLKLVTNNIYQK